MSRRSTRRPLLISGRSFAAVCFVFVVAGVVFAGQTLENGVYRLDGANSSYEEGCQPPCACPIWTTPAYGVMRVALAQRDEWFEHYRITNVRLIVDRFGSKQEYVGEGTYVIGGDFAYVQRLELDLRDTIGNEVRHYDSGWAQVHSPTGAVLDIAVAVNGFFCFDYVFRIVADRVDDRELTPYRLAATSTYQEGCFDPCDCILYEPQRMTGTFRLVEIRSEWALREFVLMDVSWRIDGGTHSEGAPRAVGTGSYRLVGDFTETQELVLDLRFGETGPLHFRSEVEVFHRFPRIDIGATINGMVCFDRVLRIDARPIRLLPERASSLATD